MARLVCPMCRRALPEGETHCPRCGLRIAPLDRPHSRRALQAAGVDLPDAATEPLGIRTALLLGAAGGVALLGIAALIAFAVTRGSAYGTALSNAAFFTGGVTLTIAVALGGVRVSRLLGDVELMRRRARGERAAAAHDHVRLGIATAAVVPLAVAIGLAAAQH
jgi:hypothetical protein